MKKLLFLLMIVSAVFPLLARAATVDGCEPGYKFSATTGHPCSEVVDLSTLSAQVVSLTQRVAELERQVKILQGTMRQSDQSVTQQEEINLEKLPLCASSKSNHNSCKYYNKNHDLRLCTFSEFEGGFCNPHSA